MRFLLAALILRAAPVVAGPVGMVWIPEGVFTMGEATMDDTRPLHSVWVDGFWMDETEVTNSQFEAFVTATGYVTVAERPLEPADFPGVPRENLVPGALVFASPDHSVSSDNVLQWWKYLPGASWQHPEGPDSNIDNRSNHPVVHIAWEDANAYAAWAGKRLPTEAEWERAARGDLEGQPFVWGSEFVPAGRFQANTFQGNFPSENTAKDGFETTAPVRSFPANGFGLYDVAGNVWEWCLDWYEPSEFKDRGAVTVNPYGPAVSFDPGEPGVPKRVMKGGSFLCTNQYCSRYMPGGRGKGEPSTGSNHVGFRCVSDPSVAAP